MAYRHAGRATTAIPDGLSINYPVGKVIAQTVAARGMMIPDADLIEDIRTHVERRVARATQMRSVDPWIRDIVESEVRAALRR